MKLSELSPSKQREIQTKRQYRFELEAPILEQFREQLSLKTLTNFAKEFWKHEGVSWKDMPKISFGKGVWHRDRYISYADTTENSIVLIENERDKITVLHEMIHIIGHPYHDRAFYSAQIKYLYLFCDFDFKELVNQGQKFKLEYRF